jgi:hypothetical protein
MWKRAGPQMISTSCSEERSSSVSGPDGSWRATSSMSRAGRTTVPSRSTWAMSGTRRPISMSVARSSTSPPAACTCTPDSAWTAERVDATRDAVCSWPSSSWLVVESFTMSASVWSSCSSS